MRARFVFLVSFSALAFACATTQGEPGEPEYASSAEQNMKLGNEALANKNYLEAEKYFEHVKRKYPFQEVSREAELRLADAQLAREKFIEARESYLTFIKLHPTHPKVDYAAYHAALTYYRDIPSDFFLLPPSYEKDQGDVRGALRSMNDFLRMYPKSRWVPDAREVVLDTRKRLARYELYVGEFYLKRGKWPGAAQRFERLLADFAGLGMDEDALFGLHAAYGQMGETEKATSALERIIQLAPKGPGAAKAKKLLGKT
jgi:outer membrane protein assembly factor BamD